MSKIIDTIIGNIDQKKEWRAIEKRAKKLPKEYRIAYLEIRKYIWNSTGISTMEPFKWLLDLFEESIQNGRHVLEVTGNDVAAFTDDLVKGEKSYFEDWRKKLNRTMAEKLGKEDEQK